MNCIIVDIGNSCTKLAWASGSRLRRIRRIPGPIRDRSAIEREIRRVSAGNKVDGAVLCSVVPHVGSRWIAPLRRAAGTEPTIVSHRIELGVRLTYPRPATIGADRLADVCGAVAQFGSPIIVLDVGTAATFNVVREGGVFVGGAIAPGPLAMTEYLAGRTALLPRIRLAGECPPLGRSTHGAIQVGIGAGYRGMVRAVVEHLERGAGLRGARLCATGGWARWVVRGLGVPAELVPHLTLRGCVRIAELNAG